MCTCFVCHPLNFCTACSNGTCITTATCGHLPAVCRSGCNDAAVQEVVLALVLSAIARTFAQHCLNIHIPNNSNLAACLQDEFELVGIVLGLACYNGVIIDAHLPLPAYKKLMGLVRCR